MKEETKNQLLFVQEKVQLLQNLGFNASLNQLKVTIRFESTIRQETIYESINKIIENHAVLKTAFCEVPLDSDKTGNKKFTEIPFKEISGLDDELDHLITVAFTEPFDKDLKYKVPFVGCLFWINKSHYLLKLIFSSAYFDDYSIYVFVEEFFRYLSPTPAIPGIKLTYQDLYEFENKFINHRKVEKIEYWQNELMSPPAYLEFRENSRKFDIAYKTKTVTAEISPDLLKKLEAMSLKNGIKTDVLLFAMFSMLLHRYTDSGSICLGYQHQIRDNAVQGAIAPLTYFLPIVSELEDNITLIDFFNLVNNKVTKAVYHFLPVEIIIENLKNYKHELNKTHLFQVVYCPDPTDGIADSARTDKDFELHYQEHAYYQVAVKRRGGLLMVEFADKLYNVSVFKDLLEHYCNMLKNIIEINNVSKRVFELNYVSDSELAFVTNWNSTVYENDNNTLVHTAFEDAVNRFPDNVAVVYEKVSVSYRELDEKANKLSNYLINQGLKPTMLVAVSIDRSIDLVVSLLAVLKAGAAYIPIEPELPMDRIIFQMNDCKPQFLVTYERYGLAMPVFWSNVINIDDLAEDINGQSSNRPAIKISESDLMYIIYTSGTTGNPKGAMLHHKGVLNRLVWGIKNQLTGNNDSVLQKTQIGFDVSVWEIFGPLLCGGKVVIANPEKDKDVNYLIDLICRNSITHIDFVPSMLHLFLENKSVLKCTSIKKVTAAGETLTKDLIQRFFNTLPKAELLNLYGPTEASLAVTGWKCVNNYEHELIPIGVPMHNCKVYVLDRFKKIKPPGYPGEIYIGGVAVGSGYLNRNELTADRFVDDTFSNDPGARLYKTGDYGFLNKEGELHFLGRKDEQIKLRGYRIEIGEIEAVLSACIGIKEAAVVIKGNSSENKYLSAYLVIEKGFKFDVKNLKLLLNSKLPKYMIPSSFTVLEAMPLTFNGKTDKANLKLMKDHFSSNNSKSEPKKETEIIVRNIWIMILESDNFGCSESFFEVGGNSLLALRLIEAIFDRYKYRLSIFELIECNSIELLSRKIEMLAVSSSNAVNQEN